MFNVYKENVIKDINAQSRYLKQLVFNISKLVDINDLKFGQVDKVKYDKYKYN